MIKSLKSSELGLGGSNDTLWQVWKGVYCTVLPGKAECLRNDQKKLSQPSTNMKRLQLKWAGTVRNHDCDIGGDSGHVVHRGEHCRGKLLSVYVFPTYSQEFKCHPDAKLSMEQCGTAISETLALSKVSAPHKRSLCHIVQFKRSHSNPNPCPNHCYRCCMYTGPAKMSSKWFGEVCSCSCSLGKKEQTSPKC